MEALEVLSADDIALARESTDMVSAIRFAGQLLVDRGAVDAEYVEGMLEREQTVSTYLGNGVALPHGMLHSKPFIKKTAIVIAQFPDGVDWGMGTAHLVVGLAAIGEDHIAILSQLAEILQDEALCEQMWTTNDVSFILDQLTQEPEEEDDDEDDEAEQ